MTSITGTGAGATGPSSGRMTEAEFRSLYQLLRSRLPWGPDDRRGALNHLTPAETSAAAGEVRLGRAVSLAVPVEGRVTPDNPDPAQHLMKGPPAADAGPGLAFSMDRIAMNIHGNADSHLDALCHAIFDGELYNRVDAGTITEDGASELSVGLAADGIVGRGVLLDVPRSRGVPWLEPGDTRDRRRSARGGAGPGRPGRPGRHPAGTGGAPTTAEGAWALGRRRGPGRAASGRDAAAGREAGGGARQ